VEASPTPRPLPDLSTGGEGNTVRTRTHQARRSVWVLNGGAAWPAG